MMHISEDDLLAYALETLAEPDQSSRIAEHLTGCELCQARLKLIGKDLTVISGVRPTTHSLPLPILGRRESMIRVVVRTAALVILSFAAGYAASTLMRHEPAHATPDYVKPTPATASAGHFAPCDATASAWRPGDRTVN